jgi:transcriptional regulator with XRE-family HTH domain
LGHQLRAWRQLQSLTIEQVAERAATTRQTVARLESGDEGVSIGIALEVMRALGVLDGVVSAADPYESDLGRARADEQLPKRVRS